MPAVLNSQLDLADLQPQAGESQPDFAIRFHEAAREAIPNTDERNSAMLEAWQSAYPEGDELDQLADRHYPTAKYHRVRNVPVFAEHAYDRKVRRNGQPGVIREKYDRDALKAMVHNMNHQIRDTGNYSAITEGHTPDESDKDAKQPAVTGFCGPFKLGMVGNVNPRWAILQDEHWLPEHADKIQVLPNRSPEVYADRPIPQRIFHPVAALGSIPPALNMGMVRYRMSPQGERVKKYSAAYGGAFSGMPQQMQYQDAGQPNAAPAPPQPQSQPQGGGLNDQLVDAIVSKVMDVWMQSDIVQWVASKMQSEQQRSSTGGQPGTQPAGQAQHHPAPPQHQPPMANPSMGGHPQRPQYQAGPDGDELEDVIDDPDDLNGDDDVTTPEKYALLERENAELKTNYAALLDRVAALENGKKRVERYSRLAKLKQEEGYVLDPDQEADETIGLNDEQFGKHIEKIVKRYQRLPVAGAVPELFVENSIEQRPSSGQAAAVTAEDIEQVVKYQQAKGCSYETALAEHMESKKSGKSAGAATKVA